MAERARVAVLISGRGSNMAALIYAAKQADCPYEVALIVSNDPEAEGLKLAEAEGIAIFASSHKGVPRADFDTLIHDALQRADIGFVALAGYMRLLSPGFVERWAGRIVNIHPSLLPRHKGLDTHARAIAAGDTVSGCSVHVATVELDDGPILGQTEVAIIPGDTAETLAARVLFAEHQLYPRTLAAFVSRERDPDYLLGKVREAAMAMIGAEETVSHGMPAFRVTGGRMFAYFTHDHHGDAKTALIVKVSGQDEMADMIDRDPDLYFRPAYFGPSGWIGVRLDGGDVDWDHVGDRIAQSWEAIAPRKFLEMGGR